MKFTGILYWIPLENKEACLTGVLADRPEVFLPDSVQGRKITQIHSYCFSKKAEREGEQETCFLEGKEMDRIPESSVRDFVGNYVESVHLPEMLYVLGRCAFYNCVNLRELILPKTLTEIESDSFLNCVKLKRIYLHASPEEKTGLKQLLIQLKGDMEILFGLPGEDSVRIFFPEYSENYDEIGPAHIFELNLTGEGFRARQCFRDGVFEFDRYDKIFEQACVEERPETLIRMCRGRLQYPYGLSEMAKKQYLNYLKEHAEKVGEICLQKREVELLEFYLSLDIFEEEEYKNLTRKASRSRWPEGVVALMKGKAKKSKHEEV